MSDMPPPPPRPAGGDLRRAAAANLLAATGTRAPPARTGGDKQQRQGQQSGCLPLAAAVPALSDGAAPTCTSSSRDASLPLPLPWSDYFDGQQQVYCAERDTTFNVYTAGTSGPVLLCLHGGGYTGLSWALIAKQLKARCRIVAPDLRCHGLTQTADEADFSADTLAADVVAIWQALFGSSSSSSGGSGSGGCGRTAGSSGGIPASSNGGSSGADAQQQEQQQAAGQQQQQGEGDTPPPTVLVGHSMGGAIAVHAAALAGIPCLAGIVVIDVVEGTALASLPYMSAVLQKRPQQFVSLQQAVDWAFDSGMCKRQEAAHISLPAMLRQRQAGTTDGTTNGSNGSISAAQDASASLPLARLPASGLESLAEGEEGEEEEEGERDGEQGAGGQQQELRAAAAAAVAAPAATAAATLPAEQRAALPPRPPQQQQSPEEEEQQHMAARAARHTAAAAAARGGGGSSSSSSRDGSSWVWRTPLELSAPFWVGWYEGLSGMFLGLPVPKVLVLVGTDRLDRSLTIGQMQGKFQPVLLPQAGHAVHEDEPERTAEAIATFIKRFRIGEPPLQIPRPSQGVRPVLPVAMGPAFLPQ